MVSLSQSVHVSLAYRLWNNQWSHERNLNVYGNQASLEGVGGNWRIELALGNSEARDSVEHLKTLLDHRCLFTDVEPFLEAASTLERVTLYLASQIPGSWQALRVFESERLYCSVKPGSDEVEITQRENNLWLALRGKVNKETGLLLPRATVTQQVIKLFKERGNEQMADERKWSQMLFRHLREALPLLESLRIDLGRDRYIFLSSKEN